MKFSIIPTPLFKREAKRLVKKYPSIKEELIAIGESLSNNPRLGIDLGNNTYKIRIAIKSKGEEWRRKNNYLCGAARRRSLSS